MIRLAVIGAGAHSRQFHLASLAAIAAEQPGRLELTALCDLDAQRARQGAAAFGFLRTYTDAEAMLRRESIDAIVAVTPTAVTAEVAIGLMAAGKPLLMEKPLGASLAQAEHVARAAADAAAPVMVSMNRRFEPLLSAGRAWLAGRRVRYARAQMLRHGRTESQFVTETGLHVLDTVGWLAGGYAGAGAISADAADGAAGAHPDPGTDRDGAAPVRVAPPVGGVEGVRRLGGDTAEWYILDVVFAGGSAGRVEIFPSAGANAERYELTGDGWYLVLASSFFDEGLAVAREGGETVWQYRADPAEPVWRRTGTYDETLAFLDAVEGRCDFSPTPADVLPATRVAYAARRV